MRLRKVKITILLRQIWSEKLLRKYRAQIQISSKLIHQFRQKHLNFICKRVSLRVLLLQPTIRGSYTQKGSLFQAWGTYTKG